MAKFELPIYGENDEIIKTYETDHIRWGIFIKALEMQKNIEKKSEFEQLSLVGDLMKSVFTGLTDEDLEKADMFDLFNVFAAIIKGANKISLKNG